jgi:hypothetical protein
MRCKRCNGLMVTDDGTWTAIQLGEVKRMYGLHCIGCGEWFDERVLENRFRILTQLPKGFHHFPYKRRQNTKEVER